MHGFNNEEIGISAEIAIAKEFNVPVADSYIARGDNDVMNMIQPYIKSIFEKENIPNPIKHIAEGQNPVDFLLDGGKTLSVKTNQQFNKKVAPQNVGQPTSGTYFHHFRSIYGNNIPNSYREKCELFKKVSIARIDEIMAIYWKNLFHCDYLLHLYNIVNSYGMLTSNVSYMVYPWLDSRSFDKSKFSFTQNAQCWNESCTVKYCGIAIGEFQVHKNRDCFKFRFNMDGVNTLLSRRLL